MVPKISDRGAGWRSLHTRGRLSCPIVVRAPYGGGIKAPEHHSESPEAFYAHIPGIRTVIPSSPRAAYGLLLAAIRDPDPVVFLEPKRIYRAPKEPVEDDGEAVPLDRCFVVREGHAVRIDCQPGYESPTELEVLPGPDGVHPEDLVIIVGADRVSTGDPVRLAEE